MSLLKPDEHTIDPFDHPFFKQLGFSRAWSPILSERPLATWSPKVDVTEGEKQITVHAELPGVKRDNIHLEVDKGHMTIWGEKKHKKEEKTEKYHRYESSYGKFSRTVRLPEGVDAKSVNAKFDDGVLEVTYPKPAGATGAVAVKIN